MLSLRFHKSIFIHIYKNHHLINTFGKKKKHIPFGKRGRGAGGVELQFAVCKMTILFRKKNWFHALKTKRLKNIHMCLQ